MAQMFQTKLTPASFTSNQELSLAIGPASTIVLMTSNASRTFFGLAAQGGNIDGMVVCFVNISGTASWQHTFAHDSSSASNVANRFLNFGQTNVQTGSGYGAAWYRYDGSSQRWLMLMHT